MWLAGQVVNSQPSRVLTCCLPVPQLATRGWQRYSLLLASDGVWDLYGFDEVASALLPSWAAMPTDLAAAAEFCEATRAKGNEYFGEAADNLTGVLVDLAGAIESAEQGAAVTAGGVAGAGKLEGDAGVQPAVSWL